MATKKKNKDVKKQKALARKSAVESLEFLTRWGLKQFGYDNDSVYQTYAQTELNYIDELDLVEDLLNLRKFIDKVKNEFGQNVVAGMGDFTDSVVCLALGISQIEKLDNIEGPSKNWEKLVAQKLVAVYYPESKRNEVVTFAKEYGFNMSAHLGRPILKLNKLFVVIERAKGV